MKERNLLNVPFSILLSPKNLTWTDTLYQFMKEKNLLNVTFVTLDLHIRAAWLNICHQFMKIRNLWSAHLWCLFYYKKRLEKALYFSSWRKKTYKCDICDASFAHKPHFKGHISSWRKEAFQMWHMWCQVYNKAKFENESVHEGIKAFQCNLCNARKEAVCNK